LPNVQLLKFNSLGKFFASPISQIFLATALLQAQCFHLSNEKETKNKLCL
jgi:hypothetical protein